MTVFVSMRAKMLFKMQSRPLQRIGEDIFSHRHSALISYKLAYTLHCTAVAACFHIIYPTFLYETTLKIGL